MTLLDDILKGLPVNPSLREKVSELNSQKAAAETENSILKDDLRNAKTEIAKLEKQIEELTHIELDDTDRKLLLVLASGKHHRPRTEIIASEIEIHPEAAQYRLDQLCSARYIERLKIGVKVSYLLAHKGRGYLINNGLI